MQILGQNHNAFISTGAFIHVVRYAQVHQHTQGHIGDEQDRMIY